MKRWALPFVLLLAVLVPRARAEDLPVEPPTVEETVFVERQAWREPPEEQLPDHPWLPEGPDAAAARLMQRIRLSPLRVGACAYRFDRLPVALARVRAGTSPVLGPEANAAVAAAVREGALELLHAVSATGPVGAELCGEDIERRNAVLRRSLESAIGVVVSYPEPAFLRAGLRLRANVGLTASEGVTVRYHVVLADAPISETTDTLGGSVDYVSVPALLAGGTVRLLPGEAAAILRVEEDGSGRLVLLSVTGRRPDVAAVTDLGGGVVAVLAGHLTTTEARPAARLPGVYGLGSEAESERPFAAAWGPFADAAGVGDGVLEKGPFGLRFVSATPAARRELDAHLLRGAALRGTRGRIDVSREGWGSLFLPASPGTAWRFFSGTVGTARGGTQVESGCNHCVLAAPTTARTGRGLEGAGWACVDGTVDVTLAGREILDLEHRPYALRRIEDGYRAYARDPFELPLVRERVLALRGALPDGQGGLPGGVRLHFRFDPPRLDAGWVAAHVGDRDIEGAIPVGGGGCLLRPEGAGNTATATWAPVPLRISGEPVPVRPGVDAWFRLTTHYPYVRRWMSSGWCGMRARYPVPDGSDGLEDGIREGTSLALRARHEDGVLLLDVEGEIRGAPEDLGSFDPGDGPVRIVRSPRIRFDVRALPLGGGGRLAHGSELDLVIEREEVEAELGPHLRLACRSARVGTASLRTGRSAGGWLDAGADWLVPSAFTIYTSSHETGQVSTTRTSQKDGIVLGVEQKREHARVDVRIRSRPAFEPYRLMVDVEPDRPESEMTLLCLRRRAARHVFYLDGDDRLEYRSPDLSSRYEVSARVVSSEGEK